MTGHEALKLIYDLTKENSEKLDAKTIFLLGESVGTLDRIINEKVERIRHEGNNEKRRKTKEKALDDAR